MNNNKKQLTKRGLIFILFIVIISAIGTILMQIETNRFKEIEATHQTPYGIQGLPYGIELAKKPQKIGVNYIYYSDRIRKLIKSDFETNQKSASMIMNFMNTLPEDVSKTVILVPNAITYEKELPDYSEESIKAINEIKNGITSNINLLDVNSIFASKENDYLYYRTDSGWTALAAYYSAQQFLESRDIEIINLDQYDDYIQKTFYGVYANLPDANLNENTNDYIGYYLLPGGKNHQVVTVRRDVNDYETFGSPTVALSRRGTDIFIEGNYSDSIISGDGNNNKTLLVVGDSHAKVFATWMIPYFENIVLINAAFYKGGEEEFTQLFKDYYITDVVMIEGISNIGKDQYNSKINDLIILE
jgi:hypothetical protein